MASSSVETQVSDPRFIKYLFDPKEDYDWYFVVGNGKNGTPVERIGVVKKMLLAHSAVFRTELHESKLKEKNNTEITDIFPDTFRNLLRYIYGYDNTARLSFDDADDLLYAADKYMMSELKASLASRLIDLLSYENICSLMNNLACYRVLELNAKITQILQFETRKVLESPQFLDLSAEGFLAILEQEKLKVTEIELWRSAVQWAKNKANSDNGVKLREQLKTHLPHIRVCTVSLEDFCREIIPTQVLTDSEVAQICMYHGNKDIKPALPQICDVTKPRSSAIKPALPQIYYVAKPRSSAKLYKKSHLLMYNTSGYSYNGLMSQLSFDIITQEYTIELCSLVLFNFNNRSQDCTVKIQDCEESSSLISLTAHVQSQDYTIDLSSSDDDDGRSVILLPSRRYRVTVSSSISLDIMRSRDPVRTHAPVGSGGNISCQHFSLLLTDKAYGYSGRFYLTCIKSINYKILTPQ